MPFYDVEEGQNPRKPLPPFKEGMQTCLICGDRNDWKCRVTVDESLALCSYERSYKRDAKRRWIHKMNNQRNTVKPAPGVESQVTKIEEENGKSDCDKAEALSTSYHCWLTSLKLSDEHRSDLLKRGLSDDFINSNKYATVPSYEERHSSVEKMAEFLELDNLPGFYLDRDRWCINLTFPGFYIPYRDPEGNISGLQIRRDEGERKIYVAFFFGQRGWYIVR